MEGDGYDDYSSWLAGEQSHPDSVHPQEELSDPRVSPRQAQMLLLDLLQRASMDSMLVQTTEQHVLLEFGPEDGGTQLPGIDGDIGEDQEEPPIPPLPESQLQMLSELLLATVPSTVVQITEEDFVFIFALGDVQFSGIDGGIGENEPYRDGGFGAVPASSEAIAGLPETTVGETREKQCAVCLEVFEADDKLRKMPCSHGFHESCIFDWLRVSRLCPHCRFALPADEGSETEMQMDSETEMEDEEEGLH